jgi:hypothetical protein
VAPYLFTVKKIGLHQLLTSCRHQSKCITASMAPVHDDDETLVALRTNNFDKLLNFLFVDEKEVCFSGASSHKLVSLQG